MFGPVVGEAGGVESDFFTNWFKNARIEQLQKRAVIEIPYGLRQETHKVQTKIRCTLLRA